MKTTYYNPKKSNGRNATVSFILLVILLTTSIVKGQTKEIDSTNRNNFIRLELTFLIDDKEYKSDKFKLTVNNLTTNIKGDPIPVSEKVVVNLFYDSEYEINVTHLKCNTKSIYVNTRAPKANWYLMSKIGLEKGINKIIQAGAIVFDKEQNTFKQVKS